MKRKILWMLLSFLLVAALVLASCAPAVVGEEEEEEEEAVKEEVKEEVEEEVVAPAVGVPQYGGTLTVLQAHRLSKDDPSSPDIADGFWSQTMWLSPIQERPLVGDFEKYGPRGTGEFAFQLHGSIPPEFIKGQLLEDWEISPKEVVWHIRPGIYWQGRDVMESRELTAEDIVADLIYFSEAPGGKSFKEMTADIYATDRYTLVIEFSKGFTLMLMYVVGYEDRAAISPPEIEGSEKWEDQVGTGPFMFKEYVVGSYMRYIRNPNYWGTTTIDGVEYQLPFVDELIFPIIPDESTQIAALRTGKVDYSSKVNPAYWTDLYETAPEIQSALVFGPRTATMTLLHAEPPLDDVNVRRALMIGTNIKAFTDLLGDAAALVPSAPINLFPAYPGDPSVYVPLEELPTEARLLYEYNPTLAKQMLAEAGYPDGFAFELVVPADVISLDRAALIADQWTKIGVGVEIKALDEVAYAELRFARTYKHALTVSAETADLSIYLGRSQRTGAVLNWSDYSNELVDELIDMMLAEMDVYERTRLAKKAALIVLNDVNTIPLQPGLEGNFWWPWLKNYYGELNVHDWGGFQPLLAYIWIDQDLKY